jgi:hypothetical protein
VLLHTRKEAILEMGTEKRKEMSIFWNQNAGQGETMKIYNRFFITISIRLKKIPSENYTGIYHFSELGLDGKIILSRVFDRTRVSDS